MLPSKTAQALRNERDSVGTAERTDLADLERPALEVALDARGHQRFHARQIFRWIYRRGVTDVAAMTDLSLELRAALARDFTLTTPALAHRETSIDGTEKFLLRLADGRHIESVFIPDTPAMTFCISTQVGCAMACAFCLTGKMGLVRNLTAGEIVGQVRVLAGALDMRDTRVQHRADGHGRAAAQLRRDDEGAADPGGRARVRHVAAPDHAVDRRPAAGARAAGAGAGDAEPRHLASRADRPAARRAGADQQEIRRQRHHRGVQAVPAQEAEPHHVRVRAAGRRERLAAGCAAAREAGRRREIEGEPDPAERRRRHPVRAAVRRGDRSLRAHRLRARRGRVGAQEPRPGYPRRLRAVDRRGAEEISRSAARRHGIWHEIVRSRLRHDASPTRCASRPGGIRTFR